MLSKIDVINMSKHILRRDRGMADRRLMHPGRDWMIGLLLTAVLFVTGGAWAGYQYVYVTTLEPEVKPPLPVARVNRNGLENAIGMYTDRRTEYEAALSASVSRSPLPRTTIATSSEAVATTSVPAATTSDQVIATSSEADTVPATATSSSD